MPARPQRGYRRGEAAGQPRLTMSPIALGALASLAAGGASALGALPLLAVRRVPDRLLHTGLGLAAGVMTAASVFSLLLPAQEAGGLVPLVGGLVLGGGLIAVLDWAMPHAHPVAGIEGRSSRMQGALLLLAAMVLHNIPEGLAVGVGFGQGASGSAAVLAVGMGVQNIPEGAAVAFPMVAAGASRRRAIAYATASGLVEPIAALAGGSLVALVAAVLPWAMAFAAGAMLYVVFGELLPESYGAGQQKVVTLAVMVGFTGMVVLEALFG
jgi:ZIP family zinc transporter